MLLPPSLLGTADSSMTATHAQAVRGPSRARPGREGPSPSLSQLGSSNCGHQGPWFS